MAFAGREHMKVAVTANVRISRYFKGVVASVPGIDEKHSQERVERRMLCLGGDRVFVSKTLYYDVVLSTCLQKAIKIRTVKSGQPARPERSTKALHAHRTLFFICAV